jgi:hypothetical protein
LNPIRAREIDLSHAHGFASLPDPASNRVSIDFSASGPAKSATFAPNRCLLPFHFRTSRERP